ncbi:L-seryl-tRNA(Sec) selenium transferase [bacterium]|nr:L-seryl-tRNA(Sec) selenium transferase [FCB group bacterium]MBL7191543.1 L-seryl-tRNA(Sec) selenium transferase [bacterium]
MIIEEKRKKLLNSLIGMPNLLNIPVLNEALRKLPQLYGNFLVRNELEKLRQRILTAELSELDTIDIEPELLAADIARLIHDKAAPSVYPAVNAAGIILHTALGRSPLAEEARMAVNTAAEGYSTVAIDRYSGKRGDRYLHVQDLLCFLTGAEAACVVNNNSAATIVLLNSMAEGKEVIVSRGQLVEIGGSFRIPDVMMRSKVVMVEVGTTNKTHLRDYKNAISENTGLLLRVHASNYLITGFTQSVPVMEMADLAHKHDLPMADDIGSGCLIDLTEFGLPHEPLVQHSIRDGADLVCFSGDKMLGGPQCGIIVGKKRYIDIIKKNPLVRAFRCGKLTYSALEATLKLFLDRETLLTKHPVMRLLTRTPEEIGRKERVFLRKVKSFLDGKCETKVINGFSQMGSGSLPGRDIPSKVIQLKPLKMTVDDLANRFRKNDPPVYTRIENEAVILDFRTVFPKDLPHLQIAFEMIFKDW